MSTKSGQTGKLLATIDKHILHGSEVGFGSIDEFVLLGWGAIDGGLSLGFGGDRYGVVDAWSSSHSVVIL